MARALDWVGMDGITLPILVQGAHGVPIQVPARVDVAVDLANPEARGIHMSRLYLGLQQTLAQNLLTPVGLRQLLQDFIRSQRGASTCARLIVRYDQLFERRALISDHVGWKRYPLVIEAELSNNEPSNNERSNSELSNSELSDNHLRLVLGFSLEYSSTCPASAALSRQRNAERFATDFSAVQPLSARDVHDWLASERGLAATPHAQRSRADIRVTLNPALAELPTTTLIDTVETVLATPVQTVVKREDEQAFAERNAANLMFCEDAARRIAAALSVHTCVAHFEATVSHLESLHPHDAVARVSGVGAA